MEAQKLNETFIPKDILKKTQINNQNSTLRPNDYEKTEGNAYIQFDPIEVKFNGYELGKKHSAIVKIINKSPIPQRVHILPPTQPGFEIKVNKKGPIAAGMSENIVVNFKSDVHKYQYDVVKVSSQTGNFVIPIYAYPSIPNLQDVFPKIMDFGSVPVNQSNSFMYPIINPVPLDFNFQFNYVQQSSAFIITPIKGTVAASSTENIQVTFIPSEKKTFTAQVYFSISQFDFKPIKIKMFGTGQDKKQGFSSTRRIKSSKLNPLLKTDSKKIDDPVSKKLEPTPESQIKGLQQNQLTQKKSFIRSRTSYPKLLKKVSGLNNATLNLTQGQKLETSIKKQGERNYNNTFSKIQQLDKEKEIKFIQYLGNAAMTADQRQFQQKLTQQTTKARLQNFKQFCTSRREPELKNQSEIDLSKVVPQNVTWDINKNNDLKIRKQKLQLFMKAGSKVIAHYRLVKRLGKIRAFLSDCANKEDVRKKVEEDYAKSRDLAKQGKKKTFQKLSFSLDNLRAASFKLQFNDESQSVKKQFDTEGSPKFDDMKVLQQIKPHEAQILSYTNLNFPSDFVYMTRIIPNARQSAEQEYPLKTASLPNYQTVTPSTVYKLPLKVPTHQFIYNNYELGRLKTLNAVDEKDPEYIIDATPDHIEDQFEGWSKGDMDVLKAKFNRNMGCQFSGVSLYNYPEYGDIGFFGDIGSNLPKQIGNLDITKDDVLDEGDSDEQKPHNNEVQKVQTLMTKIEANPKVKQRREKTQLINYQQELMDRVNKNLEKIKFKYLTQAIDKIAEYNKWADKKYNRILI